MLGVPQFIEVHCAIAQDTGAGGTKSLGPAMYAPFDSTIATKPQSDAEK
jgi:hypothetical protein